MYIKDLRNDGVLIRRSGFINLSFGPMENGVSSIDARLDTGYLLTLEPRDIPIILEKIRDSGIKI